MVRVLGVRVSYNATGADTKAFGSTATLPGTPPGRLAFRQAQERADAAELGQAGQQWELGPKEDPAMGKGPGTTPVEAQRSGVCTTRQRQPTTRT